MTEVWRDIPGYVGSYQVSTKGRVKSLNRFGFDGRWLKGKMLKTSKSGESGRLKVSLCKNSKEKTILVHQLVLYAFVGKSNGLMCRHLNGNPAINELWNLKWGTGSENMQDAIIHGTLGGEQHGTAKLTNKKVLKINLILKINIYGSI
ncbi:MAG: NUMOD4 domain-containing protein [Thiomicrorhabdus sp.]|jgi:hypothetical protein|nr:NUMOD4 domain-containing protein [Thiomicrorhabdus sp.]